MIKIGLVGTPKSGKTTVFNTITKSDAEVSDYFSENLRPNLGIVNVADERLDYLAEKFNIYLAIKISKPRYVFSKLQGRQQRFILTSKKRFTKY